MNSEQVNVVECPICFDTIDGVKNCVTTECGHQFHANCLMKNISHNGFGCPCCRAQMAGEQIAEDDDDETIADSEMDEEEDDDDTDIAFHDNEYALRGLRMFTNRLEGEPIDVEDIDEDSVLQYGQPGAVIREMPTVEGMVSILEERGITTYQLVATLMSYHDEYFEWDETTTQADHLWDNMRNIIVMFPQIRQTQRNRHQVIHPQRADNNGYKPSREELDEVRENLDQVMAVFA